MTTRVLHLIKGLGPGGAERLLVNQAQATAGDDLEFRVAYLVPRKNHLVSRLESAGWETVCLDGERVWDLRWALRLRRELVARPVDVVHGHSPLVSAVSRLVLRTLPGSRRPRSIYTEHNEWGRHNRWTRLLNRCTIRREDHVIAVSEAVRRSMPDSLDVEVVIHGIDVEAVQAQKVHREAVRKELGIADHEVVIGVVANFRREKAYDVLLEAAALVTADNPDVRFVSVGQGPLEAEIRGHHARLGLGDRFLLLGYREDATRIMAGFDLFTLSSLHEGLPVSLMEARALGLPVVAAAVGGIPEALAGSSDCVLVEPGNAQALASSLLQTAGVLDGPWPALETRFDMEAAASVLVERYK